MKEIAQEFFQRKTLLVAKELIGKYLVRKIDGKIIREKITETEAYVGPHDLACHTSRGKTARNEMMFREAGTIYVYFTYGMHWMLNIVTENRCGTAILIRGTENITGPARLTKALKIDGNLNGKKLGKKSGLWIEEYKGRTSELVRGTNSVDSQGPTLKKLRVLRLPRIGVTYAGEVWANKPYRFILETTIPKR